jgi:hypothetical protein
MCQHQPQYPRSWAPVIASVTARRGRENGAYLRTLLARKQPEFARALALAERELARRNTAESASGRRDSGEFGRMGTAHARLHSGRACLLGSRPDVHADRVQPADVGRSDARPPSGQRDRGNCAPSLAHPPSAVECQRSQASCPSAGVAVHRSGPDGCHRDRDGAGADPYRSQRWRELGLQAWPTMCSRRQQAPDLVKLRLIVPLDSSLRRSVGWIRQSRTCGRGGVCTVNLSWRGSC